MLEHLEQGSQIELRGHHLFGGASWILPEGLRKELQDRMKDHHEQSGYGSDFGLKVVQFWNELEQRSDLRIKIIDTLDYFCLGLKCIRRRRSCSSYSCSVGDNTATYNVGLTPYSVYSVEQIKDALKRKIEFLTPGLEF